MPPATSSSPSPTRRSAPGASTTRSCRPWAPALAERGRLPVLLTGEAHLLSHDQLEAIRMLTSAQLGSASPLAVLLLGQPQLRASMRLGVLAALDPRI